MFRNFLSSTTPRTKTPAKQARTTNDDTVAAKKAGDTVAPWEPPCRRVVLSRPSVGRRNTFAAFSVPLGRLVLTPARSGRAATAAEPQRQFETLARAASVARGPHRRPP